MFDDHRQAALSKAATTRDAAALEACLLPDGHVALPGADPDPDATWQILGCTPLRGVRRARRGGRGVLGHPYRAGMAGAAGPRGARDPRTPERAAPGTLAGLDPLLLS